MGARQHGQFGVVVRQLGHGADDLVELRQQYLAACFAQHQRVGEVVDVFGGAGEVDEFADGFQLGIAGDLFLEEVFHRFDVVIGGALDVLDALCVFLAEVGSDCVEHIAGVFAECRYFRNTDVCGQRLQPADFHQYTMTDQPVFTEDRA